MDVSRTHLKTRSGEKRNKCNRCDFASSWACHLRTHLKTHSGEKINKCNQCNFNVNWFRYQNWCIIATRAPGDCMAKLTPLQGMRSMGFAIPPWERSWHGKTHTTWQVWLLTCCMSYPMCYPIWPWASGVPVLQLTIIFNSSDKIIFKSSKTVRSQTTYWSLDNFSEWNLKRKMSLYAFCAIGCHKIVNLKALCSKAFVLSLLSDRTASLRLQFDFSWYVFLLDRS